MDKKSETVERDTVILFTYGTLKKNGALNYYLKDQEFLGEATLKGYRMFETAHGAFPFIREGEGEVHGELFRIDKNREEILDHVEGYPELYDKETVTVVCNNENTEALAYVVTDKQLPLHVITPRPIKSGRW